MRLPWSASHRFQFELFSCCVHTDYERANHAIAMACLINWFMRDVVRLVGLLCLVYSCADLLCSAWCRRYLHR